jgi:hypothetical protein
MQDTWQKKRGEMTKFFESFVNRIRPERKGVEKSQQGSEGFSMARVEAARDENGTKWKN